MIMKPFSVAGIPPDELNSFLSGTHSDPFRILGPHRMGDDLAIRAFRPDAHEIGIVLDGSASGPSRTGVEATADKQEPIEAEKIHRHACFRGRIANASRDLDFRLRITNWDGSNYTMRDPYRYGPIMGEVDL